MRHEFTVRDTMIRAIAASRQQKPINPALIANAVFISTIALTVDTIAIEMCVEMRCELCAVCFFV